MNKEQFYELLGEVNEERIREAGNPIKKKKITWVKWGILAACVCLVFSMSIFSGTFNSGPFGNGDVSIGDIQRENITSNIDETILVSFENPSELKKVYALRNNDWFLSKQLIDFSQVIEVDNVSYVNNGADITTYSKFLINPNGEVEEVGSTSYEHIFNHSFHFAQAQTRS